MVPPNTSNIAENESVSRNGKSVRNFLIVLAATLLSVILFLGIQTQTENVSLDSLAESATPFETALSNGKPTLIEFYANWCPSCQAMAADINTLKQDYKDQVNFVMLNVDNSKWLPEILHYRVDGIPHFVYLNGAGEEIATTIGELPRAVLGSNLAALVANQALPYQPATGNISAFQATMKENAADPRGHGGLPAS